MTELDIQQKQQANPNKTYQVLARKYRSETFDDLIGQEELVKTLKNAITTGRIAHAYIFTGVRGIGKTSTARILARALNCLGPDGKNTSPTTKPCGVCVNCKSIKEDRNIDVLEMDAASNTGIDDIRELIEGVQYKPTNARYKVYIIDEVHMLSKQAFNALLKTLEEPPEYVKFIFATTDIRKIPITILSRCQRFELSRVEVPVLFEHFKKIASLENAKITDDALQLIARSAGGSVRDGLSILDQVITNSKEIGEVDSKTLSKMLGLADREKTYEIFNAIVSGDTTSTLQKFDEIYNLGTDPLLFLSDLMEITHNITKVKVIPNLLNTLPITEIEKQHITENANKISLSILNQIWQMLVKGFYEISSMDKTFEATEMLLIRISHTSTSLPDLKTIIDKINNSNINLSENKNNITNSETQKADQNTSSNSFIKEEQKNYDTNIKATDSSKEEEKKAKEEFIKKTLATSTNDILKSVLNAFPDANIKQNKEE